MNEDVQRGWFRRHWIWVVPVGCLSMLALFVGAIALLVVFVFGVMKQSDVYVQALDRLRTHPPALAALGTPIDEGTFVSGSVKVTGPSGEADLAIPVSGPEAGGTLYVVARKRSGRWEFEQLELEVEGRAQRIDLLAADGRR